MLKKNITYTDYNGNERNKDFYFNLTRAELTELQLGTDGGYDEMLRKIINAKNVPELVKTFKKLILMAYGVKSDDGNRFIKNDQLREEFLQTEAYSILFMELASNADAAAEFVNGIVPSDLAKQSAEELAKQV